MRLVGRFFMSPLLRRTLRKWKGFVPWAVLAFFGVSFSLSSQEFRATSNTGGAIDYTGGGGFSKITRVKSETGTGPARRNALLRGESRRGTVAAPVARQAIAATPATIAAKIPPPSTS